MDGLFNAPLVQAGIGMLTIWFVVAMICSGGVQLIASATGFRANHLWRSLAAQLSSPADAEPDDAVHHPRRTDPMALQALKLAARPKLRAGETIAWFVRELPQVAEHSLARTATIERQAAAGAFLLAIGRGPTPAPDAAERRAAFAKTPLGTVVRRLDDAIEDDDAKLRAWFTAWFDDQMVRLERAYRRKIRWWAALVGVVVVGITGLNSLDVATNLYAQPTRRALIVAETQRLGDEATPCLTGQAVTQAQLDCIDANATKIDAIGQPFWRDWAQDHPTSAWAWLRLLAGVGASLGAAIAGAPFWFDVLRRITGLRSVAAGKAAPSAVAAATSSW